MNPTETKGVLALLRAAYPNFYKDMPRADLLAVVNLWQKQFEEFDDFYGIKEGDGMYLDPADCVLVW